MVSNPAGHGAKHVAGGARGRSDLDGFSTQDPNPAKNTITIDGDYTSATIYDVFGKVALTTDYQKTIDVLTLSSAIYFIHITTNHTMIIKKIIIAK